MAIAAVLVILHFGRPFDYILPGRHIPAAICLIALFAGVLGGGLRVLRTPIGMAFLVMMALMVLVTPFSTWKGGSARYVVRYSFYVFSFLLPVAAAPRSLKDLKLLFTCAVLAPLVMLILVGDPEGSAALSKWRGGETSGRMELEGGTFANAADVAMTSGFIIPFWLFGCFHLNIPLVRFPLALFGVAYLVRAILLSGTRAGLVAGVCMFLVYFGWAKAPTRLVLVLCACLAVLTVPPLLPQHLRTRFGTLFSYFSGEALENPHSEAGQSALERKSLLIDSLRYTLLRPLTGVGPGQFADHRWQEGREEGVRKSYLVTHNMYTQISSEAGIPAMIAFIAVFWGVIRTARTIRRASLLATSEEARLAGAMAGCLLASTVYYCVCGMFMSLVQYVHPVLLGSLAIALERTSRLALAPAAREAEHGAGETAFSIAGTRARPWSPVLNRNRRTAPYSR
ncbi:MAG: O-antigen ligase family protein [Bryobacteraceae bacterium]